MSSHVDWHIKLTEQTNLLNIMKKKKKHIKHVDGEKNALLQFFLLLRETCIMSYDHSI